MSNNGDKVEGIKLPTEEPKQLLSTEVPKASVANKQPEKTPRPNSDFSRTVNVNTTQLSEQKVENNIKLELQVFKEGFLKATTREESVRVQERMFKLVRGIVSEKDSTVFRKGWTTFLNYINKNTDVINTTNIFKYIYMFNFDSRTQRMYNALMTVAIITANPSKRHNRRDIDFKVLKQDLSILGNVATSNIIEFYDN